MSSSSSSSLPTPRQLLTAILKAISEIPAPTQAGLEDAQGGAATGTAPLSPSPSMRTATGPPKPPTNPLRLVDPEHRPLFTTLHVLFPSVLLPALDLLDRRLVTRLLLVDAPSAAVASPPSPLPSQAVYLVRSAQNPPPGRRGARAARGPATAAASSATRTSSYLVHAAAWNCTCAAFAFAAFSGDAPPPPPAAQNRRPGAGAGLEGPGTGTGTGTGTRIGVGEGACSGRRRGGRGGLEPEEWQFGGLGLYDCLDDGLGHGDGGVPPCCKHLLACVLAESWATVLEDFLVQRTVSREEMAGIFADI